MGYTIILFFYFQTPSLLSLTPLLLFDLTRKRTKAIFLFLRIWGSTGKCKLVNSPEFIYHNFFIQAYHCVCGHVMKGTPNIF